MLIPAATTASASFLWRPFTAAPRRCSSPPFLRSSQPIGRQEASISDVGKMVDGDFGGLKREEIQLPRLISTSVCFRRSAFGRALKVEIKKRGKKIGLGWTGWLERSPLTRNDLETDCIRFVLASGKQGGGRGCVWGSRHQLHPNTSVSPSRDTEGTEINLTGRPQK